jgi:hypothetical protein
MKIGRTVAGEYEGVMVGFDLNRASVTRIKPPLRCRPPLRLLAALHLTALHTTATGSKPHSTAHHRPLPDFFSSIEIALMAGANIQESSRVAYDALTLGWAVKVPGTHPSPLLAMPSPPPRKPRLQRPPPPPPPLLPPPHHHHHNCFCITLPRRALHHHHLLLLVRPTHLTPFFHFHRRR